MNKREEIKRIMHEVGQTPLSRACGQYLSIWYDYEIDEVFLKWSVAWDCDGVSKLSELKDYEINTIYEDIKELA